MWSVIKAERERKRGILTKGIQESVKKENLLCFIIFGLEKGLKSFHIEG